MKQRRWYRVVLAACAFGAGVLVVEATDVACFLSTQRRFGSPRQTIGAGYDRYPYQPNPSSALADLSKDRRQAPSPLPFSSSSSSSSSSALRLVPIRKYHDDFTFLANSDEYRCCIDRYGRYDDVYELALAEEEDLPDVAKFVVEAFGSEAIKLSQDLGSFEKMLMTPAVELVNGYSGIVAFAEVLAGLRSRLGFRIQATSHGLPMDLSPPDLSGFTRDEQIVLAAKTSVVLALAKPHSDDDKDWHSDVIASIELRLQPCDAKIPFSLPWIDRIERFLASLVGLGKNNGKDLQPYLSNLCVDESLRGKGIGRALVRCVENIAHSSWGFNRMYLHVDLDNKAALDLYKSEGYRDVGLRWNPFWAGRAAEIGYFVKNLDDPPSSTKEAEAREIEKPKSVSGKEM